MDTDIIDYEIRNIDPEASMTFIVEPWAEEFEVKAGSQIRVEIHFSGKPESPSLEWSTRGAVLWVEGPSRCKVFVNGAEVVRKFLSDMFPC